MSKLCELLMQIMIDSMQILALNRVDLVCM